MLKNALVIGSFFILAYIIDWAFFDSAGKFVTPELFSKPAVKKELAHDYKLFHIECDEAPDAAVSPSELSTDITSVASIACMSAGHVFGPVGGKIWLYDLAAVHDLIYPERLVVAADQRTEQDILDNDEGLPFHNAHFVSVEHEVLDAAGIDEFLRISSPFMEGYHKHNIELNQLLKVHRFTLITNKNEVRSVYLAEMSKPTLGYFDKREYEGFGYLCEEVCEPTRAFRVMNVTELKIPTGLKGNPYIGEG